MEILTITNPKSGRQIKVKAWDVAPRDVLAFLRENKGASAKDLTWHIISDREAEEALEREDGDSAETNFALNIIENALDWAIGLNVLKYIKTFYAVTSKLPKPFKVCCDRRGNVYIVTARGSVIDC